MQEIAAAQVSLHVFLGVIRQYGFESLRPEGRGFFDPAMNGGDCVRPVFNPDETKIRLFCRPKHGSIRRWISGFAQVEDFMETRIFVVIFACVLLSACEPRKTQTSPPEPTSPPSQSIDAAHNSENSVNWAGVYEGMVPGANSDIHILITLGYDEKYSVTYQYVDKGSENFTESGTFRWNDAGDTIILDSKDLPPYYRVGEGHLIQLDMSGNPITGEHADSYVLKQTAQE
jgi:uncharacterized lipoprotein NlpE involved in copper resistance